MSWIPGWDSVDGAHFLSNIFFWAGIVALILLGVCEVVSHRYSERKDELTAIEENDNQRRHDKDMAALQLQASQAEERAAEATKEAENARLRAAEIERKYAWRTVLPEQSSAFLASIGEKQFPVVLQYFVSDPEAFEFASRLKGMLSKSHLSVTPQNIVPLVPPIGIVLMGPENPEKAALAQALTAGGFKFRSANEKITAVDDLSALRMSVGGRSPPE